MEFRIAQLTRVSDEFRRQGAEKYAKCILLAGGLFQEFLSEEGQVLLVEAQLLLKVVVDRTVLFAESVEGGVEVLRVGAHHRTDDGFADMHRGHGAYCPVVVGGAIIISCCIILANRLVGYTEGV